MYPEDTMAGQSYTKKQAFLEAYAELGTVTHAAKAAGIGRQTHYDWLESDEEYAEAFRTSEEAVGDKLEAEAIRRATEGVERAVYHRGEVVGYERNYSDTLLIFLLKGHKPEKYQDRARITAEVTQRDPGERLEQAKAKVLQFLPGGRAEGTGR